MKATTIALVLSDGLGSRGGIGRVMTYLAREMAVRHPDVGIIACRSRLSSRPLLKHLTVPLALLIFAVRCLFGAIDVAHINVARSGSTWRKLLFAKVARLIGVRVVLHLHGSGYDAYFAALPFRAQTRIRTMFRAADAVVALSPYWQGFIVHSIGVPAARVHVIANGVPDPGPPDPGFFGPAPGIPVILFLGELGPRKGTDTLIEALAALAAEQVSFRAVLGGNGMVDEARAQARAFGIEADVDFPGWVGEDEVARYLAQAYLFVLPSRAENQPLSILEAMARGVPVVSTRVGAIAEQVIDGKSGYVIDPGNAIQLAQALSRLLQNPVDARAMGMAGRRHFEQDYALAVCADRFAKLYRDLVQDPSPPSKAKAAV